jgi:hypothetical protein
MVAGRLLVFAALLFIFCYAMGGLSGGNAVINSKRYLRGRGQVLLAVEESVNKLKVSGKVKKTKDSDANDSLKTETSGACLASVEDIKSSLYVPHQTLDILDVEPTAISSIKAKYSFRGIIITEALFESSSDSKGSKSLTSKPKKKATKRKVIAKSEDDKNENEFEAIDTDTNIDSDSDSDTDTDTDSNITSHNSESIVEDSDSRVYTAIVPIYLTNTTMPTSPLVSLSQYTCVRKAVQLAIYAAISQKDVPLLVSMPAITAVPKTVTSTSLRRGLSAYDREAEFMVRVNITTVTDKSILESVLTTLYERIHIAPGTKDLVNNIGLSDQIRSFAAGDDLKNGAIGIASTVACSTTPCTVLTFSNVPTTQPTVQVIDVAPGIPTEQPISSPTPLPGFPTCIPSHLPTSKPSSKPSVSPGSIVNSMSLSQQCEEYEQEHFHSALWGLYGAHYTGDMSTDSIGNSIDSGDNVAVPKDPQFYRVWLILLLVVWVVCSLYIAWKCYIGYASCEKSLRELFPCLLDPSQPQAGAERQLHETKRRYQFWQVVVASIIIICRIVYIALVLDLTEIQRNSSFFCVEMSPYLDAGEKFGSNLFYLMYGLYAPFLLTSVVLRQKVVQCVQIHISPRIESTSYVAISKLGLLSMFVAICCVVILFATFAMSQNVIDGVEKDINTKDTSTVAATSAEFDSGWAAIRHWGVFTQALCGAFGFCFQLAVLSTHTQPEGNMRNGQDGKLRRSFASHASTVVDPSNVSAMDDRNHQAQPIEISISSKPQSRSRSTSSSEGLHQRISSSSTMGSQATKESDDSDDMESNNMKAAGSGGNGKSKSRIKEISNNININKNSNDVESFGHGTAFAPPPIVQDGTVWAALTATCLICFITSIPSITTGSWFGSFILYSSLQRMFELITVCACLRFIHVHRSHIRKRFFEEVERSNVVFTRDDEVPPSPPRPSVKANFSNYDNFNSSYFNRQQQQQHQQHQRQERSASKWKTHNEDSIPAPNPISVVSAHQKYAAAEREGRVSNVSIVSSSNDVVEEDQEKTLEMVIVPVPGSDNDTSKSHEDEVFL